MDDAQAHDAHFGTAVRTRRAQLGITLDQLAQASGVSAAALSRVERGLLSPSLRNALAIAQGLGCELAELVARESAHITRAGHNLRFLDEATGIERVALARPSPDVELLTRTPYRQVLRLPALRRMRRVRGRSFISWWGSWIFIRHRSLSPCMPVIPPRYGWMPSTGLRIEGERLQG